MTMAKMRDKDRLPFKVAVANMSKKEKLGYIWEYYRLIIISSICAVFAVVSITYTLLTQRETYLDIVFVSGFEATLNSFEPLENGDVEPDDHFQNLHQSTAFGFLVEPEITTTLSDALFDYRQLNNYELSVRVLPINFETIPVFTTHIAASMIDLMVTYPQDLQAMTEIGYFKKLADLGWEIPESKMHNDYAIYLRYFPIFDDYITAFDSPVLGISATTANIEHVKNFFNTLLD